MGLFDFLVSLVSRKKRKETKEESKPSPLPVIGKKKKEKKTVVVEEIKPESVKKPKKPRVKADELKKRAEVKNELALFKEVTDILRREANLPPMEEVIRQKREQAPSPTPAPPAVETTAPQIPTTEEKPSTPPVQPTAPSPSPAKPERKLSRAEIEKIVKVSLKRLETELLNLLEEDMRRRGVRSFKERAMERRKIREYMRANKEMIANRFSAALMSGTDPRKDDFLKPLAKEIYRRIVVTAQPPTSQPPRPAVTEVTVKEKKEKKKEKKEEEEDLLSLLASEEEEGGGEVEEDELLKLLGE